MYRAVAFGFLKHGIESTQDSVAAFLPKMNLKIDCIDRRMKIYFDEEDITMKLHTSRITEMSSRIAVIAEIREFLLKVQHRVGDRFGKDPGLIVVGRDIGTVVFPDAKWKFFVTASAEVRARRRFTELSQTGLEIPFHQVYDSIMKRDLQDSERAIAPLRKAADAIVINTDDLTPDEQAAIILGYILER